MYPTLVDLETLARSAGAILRGGFGQRQKIHYKGAIDLVTEYDHRSEEYLLGEIFHRFPGHSVVSEESGEHTGQESCMWYIDPLDGTVNFAHGLPIFSVSLAYAEEGQTRLGVVYIPILDECFSAELGRGAWLNGQPINVSDALDLDHSLLATGFMYDIRTNPANNLAQFNRLSLLSQGVRRLGSAAIDLSYVASGRLDGYWELDLKPWDVGAGGLIASEAGAIVSRVDGSPDYLGRPCSILAASPKIYPEMMQVLRP